MDTADEHWRVVAAEPSRCIAPGGAGQCRAKHAIREDESIMWSLALALYIT